MYLPTYLLPFSQLERYPEPSFCRAARVCVTDIDVDLSDEDLSDKDLSDRSNWSKLFAAKLKSYDTYYVSRDLFLPHE